MIDKKKGFWLYPSLLIATAAILCLFPAKTAAEDFKGETELLKKLSNDELIDYFGLKYSLNDYQKKQFLTLKTRAERDKWLERFWIINDPTPTTPVNERKIEHETRVKLARKLFGRSKAPGWDRRGEVLIRYGVPATRTKVPADIGFYRAIPPGELWYYRSLDMLVAFQNFNLKGDFIFAFDVYGMTGREQQDKLQAIAQYLGNYPADAWVYTSPEDIRALRNLNPDDIDYIADVDVRTETPSDMIDAINAERTQKSKNNFEKEMKEHPVIYSYEVKENPLPVFFDVTSFNGGPGIIRTDLNFEIPTSELRFERTGDSLNARIKLEALVRDIDFNEAGYAQTIVTASQRGGRSFQGPGLIPGQITLSLKPGYYRVGIQATDLKSGRRGAYKTSLELEPLDGKLVLSDIQFASSIRETTENVKFLKGNLQIVPHPVHAYKMPFPLTFYFEIYGLETGDDGLSLYTVDYRIIPVSPKRKGPVLVDEETAISSKFETSGFGSTQAERIEIATDNLWEGTFRLYIAVMDRRTRETAGRFANFSILGK